MLTKIVFGLVQRPIFSINSLDHNSPAVRFVVEVPLSFEFKICCLSLQNVSILIFNKSSTSQTAVSKYY